MHISPSRHYRRDNDRGRSEGQQGPQPGATRRDRSTLHQQAGPHAFLTTDSSYTTHTVAVQDQNRAAPHRNSPVTATGEEADPERHFPERELPAASIVDPNGNQHRSAQS